ncbi:MAG: hypothetical protein ACRBBN_12270 [Methyloligellaceae bacterium]
MENVPEGIEVRDGREILPENKLLRYDMKNRKSYALGSDIFRYEMMKHEVGYWVDADIYVMHPINLEVDYIFGYEAANYINCAVLYLPGSSEIITELFDYIYSRPFLPPWWSVRKKVKQKILSIVKADKPITKAGWGATGPRALTHFSLKLGLDGYAQGTDIFYPLPYRNADEIFIPGADIFSYCSDRTLTIHFWNEKIKLQKQKHPPENSFIYNLCEKHGIALGLN